MKQEMALLTSHASEDWHTPKWLLDVAAEVMGRIGLDPASSLLARTRMRDWGHTPGWFGLDHPDTSRHDGLDQPWYACGGVWMNPPYGKTGGRSNAELWTHKMWKEHTCGRFYVGLALINSTHGYKWYENLCREWPVCQLRERISFERPDGTTPGPAKRGQTLVLFYNDGQHLAQFLDVFQPYGRFLLP